MKYDYDTGIAQDIPNGELVKYDNSYYDKLNKYHNNPEMNKKINKCRCDLVYRYGKYEHILDIGAGNLDFLDMFWHDYQPLIWGYDIIPRSVKKLKKLGAYMDPYKDFLGNISVFTMFDVLEHFEDPGVILKRIPEQTHLIISIPIFEDLVEVEFSKHYRPNEHYWYFTHDGMVDFMAGYGFKLKESNNDETLLGRKQITTFVFKRES